MDERVAVVTGGLGVLGSAVARAAAARGLKVAIIDHASTSAPLDGTVVLGGVDLTDADEASSAIGEVISELGGIDILFNIAGGFRWITLEGSGAEDWDRLFAINVQTAANASRAAIPTLKASPAGRIVNVGAGAAEKAAAGMGPYAAAKSGVHRLTESLAEELKGSGVTVNAVLPSIIDTLQNRADMPRADFANWVRPDELAAVMLFLASEEASAVTGALIRVSGRV
ncbi:MAG TPA: SDR family NAD(P)-dependent oxidoreductase [Caulobacteraceae bacterium]|nr:SDR family NAD(P)-dependent oxidoreductase [Caulobacteraceae bacterium]